LRFTTAPDQRFVVVVCTLDRPNAKLLPLLFAASTARELGAARVGLVAPYLAYMRQDRRFNPGEAVTSLQVASLLSHAFDWMVTVDLICTAMAHLTNSTRFPPEFFMRPR
jgi:ribose-phosphate pyrophosphokinase